MNHFIVGRESPSVEIYLSYYKFSYICVSNLLSSPQQPTNALESWHRSGGALYSCGWFPITSLQQDGSLRRRRWLPSNDLSKIKLERKQSSFWNHYCRWLTMDQKNKEIHQSSSNRGIHRSIRHYLISDVYCKRAGLIKVEREYILTFYSRRHQSWWC